MLIHIKGGLRRLTAAVALGLLFGALLPIACSSDADPETAKANRDKAKEILTKQDSEVPTSKFKSVRGGPAEGKNFKGRLFQKDAPE